MILQDLLKIITKLGIWERRQFKTKFRTRL